MAHRVDRDRQQGEIGTLNIVNVKEVFKPGTTDVVDAPQDLIGWLQRHPYLKTSEPQPVNVGGLKGEQLEVLIDHLPKDPNGYCTEPSGCLDIFYQSGGDQIGYFGKNHNMRRAIVLENVKGDTVVIWYAGPPVTFEKFAPKAQKVVVGRLVGGAFRTYSSNLVEGLFSEIRSRRSDKWPPGRCGEARA